MYVKLLKSERGFTLVELMIGMVLFTLLLGLSSKALATGMGLSGKQSSQLDLRMTSRQLLTQMEQNIQAAASINLKATLENGDLLQDIVLTHKNPDGTTRTETYEYIPSQRKIILFQGVTRTNNKIVASNLNSANFFGDIVPTNGTIIVGAASVNIAVNMQQGSESLNIATNASPRWNVGNGVPAIMAVEPRNLTDNLVNYTLTAITAINTHFTADSVVKFKQGNDTFATSTAPLLNFATNGSNSTTLNGVTLTTTNLKPLPWGFYDLYIETPTGPGETEIVWASSIITCQWDSRLWIPTIGANNSGGWNADTFPFVEKRTQDNNDKYNAYTFREMTDFDAQVKITITGGGNNKAFPDTGNTGGNVPDAEIVFWAESDHNNKNNDQHFARYLGFGIDSDSVYIRTVGWPSFPGPQTAIKLTNKLGANHGVAMLRATASNGILHFYVNGENIDSEIDAECSKNGNSTIRNYNNMNPTGYPGVIANGGISAKFSIKRF
jgi:prepilin-type N-terminal cleavage/methylation domain-containing protein